MILHLARIASFSCSSIFKNTVAGIGALSLVLVAAQPGYAFTNAYTKTNLVSDTPGIAKTLDPKLVNPWGLARSPNGPWLVANNNSGSATSYNGKGVMAAPAISVPAPDGSQGAPTGEIFNGIAAHNQHAFVITEGMKSGPSTFMFATEDGTIAGWNKKVDPAKAIITVDRSTAKDNQGNTGAVYKGLAFGESNHHHYIYAANFRFGTVEMFDENFTLAASFTDSQLSSTCPAAGQCYAPFGIQNIHGELYVTFALQKADKHDDQAGAGNGFVDVFHTDGTLDKRLIAHGSLNSPWGLAFAPHGFGAFSHHLLVGNFGDGTINAYSIQTGQLDGTLKDQDGKPIQTNGLWGLAFGNGRQAGERDELFFTAGIGDEAHGLFGKIEKNN